MSYVCDNCHKKTVFGRSQTHHRGVAGKRWKKRAQETNRTFKPNLQVATLVLGGIETRMKLCTSCLKKLKPLKKSTQMRSAGILQ